jgi:hypothetical protein
MNIPGCINYFSNICVKCRGSQILIENRCIAQCAYLRDTRSIHHYGNFMILLNAEKHYKPPTDRSYFFIN